MRIHHTDVQWAAIVSWGHPDGIIRVKNKRNSPAINFMHWNSNEQVHNFKQTEIVANWAPLTLAVLCGLISMAQSKAAPQN